MLLPFGKGIFCNNIDVDQKLRLLSVVFISTEMTKYVDVKP